MISLPAAKTLFFIALTLNANNPQKIFVTSNSETYIWVHTTKGWSFEARGFPASDFTREPDYTEDTMTPPTTDDIKGPLKAISHHNWNRDTVMIFDNGERVEKDKDAGFLIVNAGGANQKTYTILYDDNIVSK
jgi:hypothetical protein